MEAIIITIGDELLIGQVVDTNTAWIGTKLSDLGIPILEKISVGDDKTAIKEVLDRALGKATLILITGGLGPTKDDITKIALSEYFGVGLTFDELTWSRIERLFIRLGRTTTPAHRQQCYMPANAILLENKMGTAPGMLFSYHDKTIISMPGVPYEMQFIMENGVIPHISGKNGGQTIIHHTIRTVGEGESWIAQTIEDIQDQLPDYIKLAYLPSLGQVRLRLSGRGNSTDSLHTEIMKYVGLITERLGNLVYGFGELTLEEALGQLCNEKSIKIGTAESCTGGFIAHRITTVPGSSAYFAGSIISYDNQVKIKSLGVRESTLSAFGAVSEETVIEMLDGILDCLPIDVGVAVSGIAGPDGGSPDKPVGTIWIACGNKKKKNTLLIKAGKDRVKNIEYTGVIALDMLRKFILTQ